MKLKYLAFLLGAFSAAAGDSRPELKTVSSVDLNRYLGKWYEIARYPNRFEKNCVADVTAHYTLRDDGKIEVLNSCRQSDGKIKSSKGSAKVVDPHSNARLKVTFFWPFYGNYWIIDLDPDYRYAVVSEPGREYLWILSRTPQLESRVYDGIAARLRAQGLDPAKLIKPKQSGQ
jgi:apolipoprotein D and lipocalin family protein